MDRADIEPLMIAALRRRAANGGRHLHHSGCIHNMPPAEQIAMRGKTVEWWLGMGLKMPEQITSDEWEAEPLIIPPTPEEGDR